MFVTVWKFVPRPEHLARFEAAYGPEGEWARLFRRAEGYLGTTVLRSEDGSSFLLGDKWSTRTHFENFKRDASDEYVLLDIACEQLTLEETHLGYFNDWESRGESAKAGER